MKYKLKGHSRPLLCQNHSSAFVYGPILMKICMNANIMKTYVPFMLWRSFVILFTLRPSDLITTLTYVLMDNFLTCSFPSLFLFLSLLWIIGNPCIISQIYLLFSTKVPLLLHSMQILGRFRPCFIFFCRKNLKTC